MQEQEQEQEHNMNMSMEHGHEHEVNSAWKKFKLLNYLQRSACHHLGTQSVKRRYP